MTDLFTPVTVGALSLPNRIVMAPMTRNRAAAGDTPWAMNATYYQQRASAGLILTEASQICPEGKGYPKTPGIYSAEQIAGWKLVTDAVHARGGRIALQLWHVGRISHPSFQPGGAAPVAPSAIKPAGDAFTETGPQPFVTPRVLETGEIAGIVAAYAAATRNAREAGFDGVEIHGANGYLIDQFLRDGTNHRTDAYGGSIENRARFLREVIEAVVGAWSSDRVGLRLSPVGKFNDMSDSDPAAHFAAVAEMLNAYTLAWLHLVEDKDRPFDYLALRRRYRGLYIANRGYTRASADQAIADGNADLVSFGVPFISNPDLVERFLANVTLAEADHKSFYGGDEHGYIDYRTFDQHPRNESQ